MRRILLLLTVAAMMAVTMAASASPAFALPPNPITPIKDGPAISAYTRTLPPNPIHGQLVSAFARYGTNVIITD